MSDSEAGPSQVSDDEVFRRKLLMDGEGMGDSRRIDSLLRQFFLWYDADEQTPEQVTEGYEKLITMLSGIELAGKKSAEAQQANERQIEEYDKAYAEIESKIADVKLVIAEKKGELVEAKKVRKNKEKYDALANIITQLPDRKQTQERLETIGNEITELAMSNELLEKKLERREKQLGVLLTSAHELKSKIRSEEEDEWLCDSDDD